MLKHPKSLAIVVTLLIAVSSKTSHSANFDQGVVSPQTAPTENSQVVAAATELAKNSELRMSNGKEMKFDRTLLLEGGKAVTSDKKLDASYSSVQVGTQKGSGTPVFLDIGVAKGTQLAPDTVKAIANAVQAGRPDVQACAGERKCARMCEKNGKEECCEWRCGK